MSTRAFTTNFHAVALLLLLACSVGHAQPIAGRLAEKPSLAPLMREVTPAVVNIVVEGTVEGQRNPFLDDPFLRRFFEGAPQSQDPNRTPQRGAGSGVIVDADNGYILTNHHVVENADDISVTLSDRRRVTAKLVGSDAPTDIALLKIEARDLTDIEFGDSDALQVGDYVVAIGNPFGLGQTVTSGIVSALGRAAGISEGAYEDFIQTDASINPGNSGGALIDLSGRLVGINSAIISPAGGNVGIGFAVPSNMAVAIMKQIVEHGNVERGLLGITIQDLTPDLASALKIGVDEGALVTEVAPGSAAAGAGIQTGDVVTTIGGHSVRGAGDLRVRIGLVRAGGMVDLGVLRDGRLRQITAHVGAASAEASPSSAPVSPGTLQGAEFANIPQGHPQYGRVQGVLVTSVGAMSEAARAGLEVNDIVTAVNRTPVGSVTQLTQVLSSTQRPFALNVLRDSARIYIVVR